MDGFNPSRVRLERIYRCGGRLQCTRFNPSRVRLEPRSTPCEASATVASTHQGFVWNEAWGLSGGGLAEGFNPSRVRLEHGLMRSPSLRATRFNPSRVRLEPGRFGDAIQGSRRLQPIKGSSGTLPPRTRGDPSPSFNPSRVRLEPSFPLRIRSAPQRASTHQGFVWNLPLLADHHIKGRLQPIKGSSGT